MLKAFLSFVLATVYYTALHFFITTVLLFNYNQITGFYFHMMFNLVSSQLTNSHCDEEQKTRTFSCKNFQRFRVLVIIFDGKLHNFLWK